MSTQRLTDAVATRHVADDRAERATRIAAMLDRWEIEDLRDEPEWDVEAVESLALRPQTIQRR